MIKINNRVGETILCYDISSTLMKEVAKSSETLINVWLHSSRFPKAVIYVGVYV
jgi:hypothetical protein